MGGRTLIKIGIESSRRELHSDLLLNPSRYFFMLIVDSRPSLCIRTCNSQGEDVTEHIVECFSANSEGLLTPVLQELLDDDMKPSPAYENRSCFEERPISANIGREISMMPELIDWIISSILDEDRHIVINSTWEI